MVDFYIWEFVQQDRSFEEMILVPQFRRAVAFPMAGESGFVKG